MSLGVFPVRVKVVLLAAMALTVFLLGCQALEDGVATAMAGVGYKDACTSLGTPAFCAGGVFSEPVGVAVDNSSEATAGDVYAIEYNTPQVLQFNANGEKLSTIELPAGSLPLWDAVDPATGDLYVSLFLGGIVDKFEPSGNLVASFGNGGHLEGLANPSGLAVEPSTGKLYVFTRGTNEVEEYSSSGVRLGSFSASGSEPGDSLAVDAAGDIYVNHQDENVVKYPAGERGNPTVIDTNSPTAVAIDPSTEDVYVYDSTSSEIAVYGPGGNLLSSFGNGDFGAPNPLGVLGIGVNGSTHAVYALAYANSFGVIFEEGETPPPPVTEPVTEIGETEATFHGKVSPGGASGVSYYFLYKEGSSCAGGTKTTEHPVIAEEEVTETATGLLASTEYTVCVVVTNAFGTVPAPGVTFTTNAALVIAETGLPTNPLAESATLNGTVKVGAGSTAHYYFEYGVKAEPVAYTSKTPALPGVEVSEGEHLASAPATGLEPNTAYDYQLVATSGASTVTGGNQEVTTAQAPPVAVGKSATGITRTEASLPGEVNPKKSKTTYFFEYGPTAAYGSTTATEETSATLGLAPIGPARLSELHAGTTYHYRLVASSGGGEDKSEDMTFSTAAAQLPIVEAESSEQVTQTTATVTAKVNPNGLQTTYILEVGTEVEGKVAYTPTFGEVGSGSEGVSLTFALTNLLPGTTYHYRIVAVNEDGTVEGADITFATPAFPSPIVEPPHPLLIPVPPVQEEKKVKTETKLQKALKACTTKPKKKRAACIKQAERKYGPKVHKKTKAKHKKK